MKSKVIFIVLIYETTTVEDNKRKTKIKVKPSVEEEPMAEFEVEDVEGYNQVPELLLLLLQLQLRREHTTN